MPECHRCPFDGKGDPRCLTCKGPPEVNNKGRNVVSRDSGNSRRSKAETESDTKRIPVARSYNPPIVFDYALEVVYAFSSLSVEEFVLVRMFLNGATQSQMARAQGVTRQAVSLAVKKLVQRHPVFGVLRDNLTLRTIVEGGPRRAT